jgi:hypothetical protein
MQEAMATTLQKKVGKQMLVMFAVFIATLCGFAMLALNAGYPAPAVFLFFAATALAILNFPKFGRMVFQKLTLMIPVPQNASAGEAALMLERDDAKIYAALRHCKTKVEAGGIRLEYRGTLIFDPLTLTFEINGEQLHPKHIKIMSAKQV